MAILKIEVIIGSKDIGGNDGGEVAPVLQVIASAKNQMFIS